MNSYTSGLGQLEQWDIQIYRKTVSFKNQPHCLRLDFSPHMRGRSVISLACGVACFVILVATLTTAQATTSAKEINTNYTSQDQAQTLPPLQGYFEPRTIAEVQDIVRRSSHVRVVGTGLSWQSRDAAKTTNQTTISLQNMRAMLGCCQEDEAEFEGGAWLSDVAQTIDGRRRALRTYLDSDDISFIGAALTGSHGSGVGESGHTLASALTELTLVTADGSLMKLRRGDDPVSQRRFDLAVTSLGMLGVVVAFKVSLTSAYTLRQCIYTNVPLAPLLSTAPGSTRNLALANIDTLFTLGESVSAYTLLSTAAQNDELQVRAGHRVAMPLSTRSTHHMMGRKRTTREDYYRQHGQTEEQQVLENAKQTPGFPLVLTSVRVKQVVDGFGCRANALEKWSNSLTTSDFDLSTRVPIIPGRSPEESSAPFNGPWYSRLADFQEGVISSQSREPSADNIQLRSAYTIPRAHVADALSTLASPAFRSDLTKLVHIIGLRSQPSDHLPFSSCYSADKASKAAKADESGPFRRKLAKPEPVDPKSKGHVDCVTIDITWRQDMLPSVPGLLKRIESNLAKFHALPHWGTYFLYPPEQVQSLLKQQNRAEVLTQLADLALEIDPTGKFATSFHRNYILRFATPAKQRLAQHRSEL